MYRYYVCLDCDVKWRREWPGWERPPDACWMCDRPCEPVGDPHTDNPSGWTGAYVAAMHQPVQSA